VSKASILGNLMQDRSVRMSSDRTRRVAGIPAFKSPSTTPHISTDGAPSLRIGNPIAALVTCEEKIFLAVGQVNRIVLGSGDSDSVLLALLHDPSTKISFQILRLLPTTVEDDPSKSHDWRWNLSLDASFSDVAGCLVQPLNPTICNRIPGKPTYLFSSEVLIHVGATIQARMLGGDWVLIPPVKRSVYFPIAMLDASTYRSQFRSQESVECAKCDPPLPLPFKNKQTILQHNGGHILFDPTIKRSDQPCGLCLRPYPMCEFYLARGSGTDSAWQVDWKRSTCLRPLTFRMAAAMRWNATSPCTNYLLMCPLGCGVVIWTYNIDAHYRSTRHRLKSLDNIDIPYKMDPHEEAAMLKLHNEQHDRQIRNLTTTKTHPPLITSDAHSTRLAFRCVDSTLLFILYSNTDKKHCQRGSSVYSCSIDYHGRNAK
ncbi:hypothetical protein C8R44DRAFT_638603, partial [Mycena epipterygia]